MYKKRLLIIAITGLALLYTVGWVLDARYKKRWRSFSFCKMDCIYGKEDVDVLLLGDSRTHFGLHPGFVSDGSGLSSYNLGYAGADSRITNLLADMYLRRHRTPKVVVLNIDEYAIQHTRSMDEMFFLLFYASDTAVANLLQQNSYHSNLLKFLPFTKYAYFDDYHRMSLLSIGGSPRSNLFDTVTYRGYTALLLNPQKPLDTTAAFQRGPEDKPGFAAQDSSVLELHYLIQRLQKEKVQVVLLYPPAATMLPGYYSYQQQAAIATGQQLAETYKLPYYRFDTVSAFRAIHFIDHSHLTLEGAKIFSALLGQQLRALNR